jgi:hypothetical protein
MRAVFLPVPRYVIPWRCGPLCCGVHGRMADGAAMVLSRACSAVAGPAVPVVFPGRTAGKGGCADGGDRLRIHQAGSGKARAHHSAHRASNIAEQSGHPESTGRHRPARLLPYRYPAGALHHDAALGSLAGRLRALRSDAGPGHRRPPATGTSPAAGPGAAGSPAGRVDRPVAADEASAHVSRCVRSASA